MNVCKDYSILEHAMSFLFYPIHNATIIDQVTQLLL